MTPPRTVFVEVTNTLAHPSVTGLQRQTRELLAHLPAAGGDHYEITPLTWHAPSGRHRRLTPDEAAALAADPRGQVRPRPRLHDLPEWVHRRWRQARWSLPGKAVALANAELRELAARRRSTTDEPAGADDLVLTAWPAGSVFLDLEAAQHDPALRSRLLPHLLEQGVTPAVYVADVIPVLHPEWFDASLPVGFRAFLDAHLDHSRLFLFNSRCTQADLLRYRDFIRPSARFATAVVGLGSDVPQDRPPPQPVDLPPGTGRVVLCVSTLEPRKNHNLLLDAFDAIRSEHPDVTLVLVGGEGWLSRSVTERIRSHPDYRTRLVWLQGVGDRQLDWLYERAHLAVMPSFYEGYGLPVAEALARGTVTLSSTGGALPEAADGHAELFDPHDLDALVALLRHHLADDAHHQKAKASLAGYRPPTWSDAAARTVAALDALPFTR